MDDFERDFEEFLVADTDPEPYLFEPEHTDEELHVLDAAPILLHIVGFGAAIVGEKATAESASQGVKTLQQSLILA